jgi:hypothetical protein
VLLVHQIARSHCKGPSRCTWTSAAALAGGNG